MNTSELHDLYESRIAEVLNSETLCKIVNNKNLVGQNFMNVLLAFCQSDNITDIKCVDNWHLIGCDLKKSKVKPIYSLENIVKLEYFDCDTNEKIDIMKSGISYAELNKLVDLKVVYKERTVIGIKPLALYDISDIEVLNNKKYEEYKERINKNIKLSKLIDILIKNFGITFKNNVSSELKSNYYNSSDGKIYVHNIKDVDSLINSMSEALTDSLNIYEILDEQHNSICGEKIKILGNLVLKDLLHNQIDKSHESSKESFDILDDILVDTDVETIINVLISIYDILNDIVYVSNSDDNVVNYSIIHRASEILKVLEANYSMRYGKV